MVLNAFQTEQFFAFPRLLNLTVRKDTNMSRVWNGVQMVNDYNADRLMEPKASWTIFSLRNLPRTVPEPLQNRSRTPPERLQNRSGTVPDMTAIDPRHFVIVFNFVKISISTNKSMKFIKIEKWALLVFLWCTKKSKPNEYRPISNWRIAIKSMTWVDSNRMLHSRHIERVTFCNKPNYLIIRQNGRAKSFAGP